MIQWWAPENRTMNPLVPQQIGNMKVDVSNPLKKTCTALN
jgi:hypothetical protein